MEKQVIDNEEDDFIDTEAANTFFLHNVDLDSRTIYLGSGGDDEQDSEVGIDHKLAANVIKGIRALDEQDSKEPITIYINCIGGDHYHGMAIFEAIRLAKSKVNIIVLGQAFSMASVILQAADHRVASENSRILLHYGMAGIEDHTKNVEKYANELNKLSEVIEDIYLDKIKEKKPNYSRKKFKEKLKFDWYLSANEALELGLIDEVI